MEIKTDPVGAWTLHQPFVTRHVFLVLVLKVAFRNEAQSTAHANNLSAQNWAVDGG
jgi:hypothetical protein